MELCGLLFACVMVGVRRCDLECRHAAHLREDVSQVGPRSELGMKVFVGAAGWVVSWCVRSPVRGRMRC